MNVRLGPLSKILAPGYSYCRGCRTPWLFVEPRTVWYSSYSGQFALCVKCWDEATAIERMAAHLEVCRRNEVSEETIDDILDAIVRTSTEESTHA